MIPNGGDSSLPNVRFSPNSFCLGNCRSCPSSRSPFPLLASKGLFAVANDNGPCIPDVYAVRFASTLSGEVCCALLLPELCDRAFLNGVHGDGERPQIRRPESAYFVRNGLLGQYCVGSRQGRWVCWSRQTMQGAESNPISPMPGYTDGCRSLMPALDKPYGAAVETGRLEAHPQLLSVAHSAATCCFATPTGTDSDQDVTDSRGRVWNSPSIANLNTSWRQRSDLAIVGGLLFEGNHTVERHRHFDALAGSDCTWSIHCLLMVTPL
jgi:hypothetical protein